jgi:hypothetical protein
MVNLAGEQIDAGQQADRAAPLVFMIAHEGRMGAGLGRQIHRLDPGLLVIGDDRLRGLRPRPSLTVILMIFTSE